MGTTDYLKVLEDTKHFWSERFRECENPTQREAAKREFAEALAKLYGGKWNDQDIIDEVEFELGN